MRICHGQGARRRTPGVRPGCAALAALLAACAPPGGSAPPDTGAEGADGMRQTGVCDSQLPDGGDRVGRLTPLQRRVTQERGTEPAFSGEYHDFKGTGSYHCVACGARLFDSDHKFDSGTGWPSYWQPADAAAVASEEDRSHGMARTEVHCSACKAHLGHVFDDGPRPTGLRYCINSAALDFTARDAAP